MNINIIILTLIFPAKLLYCDLQLEMAAPHRVLKSVNALVRVLTA